MNANWAEHLLQAWLGVRPSEKCLTIVDQPLRRAGEALCDAAERAGANAWLHVLAAPVRGLTVVPDNLLQAVAEADLIVSLLSHLDLSTEHAPMRAAVATFRAQKRGRWAMGAFIDQTVLEEDLGGDPAMVAHCVRRLVSRLTRVEEVHITSAAGTDLRFRLGGRPIQSETGRLTAPGAMGNIPAGEVYIAPLEASAVGRAVIDLSLGDLALREQVILTFKAGRVVGLEGGQAARQLEQRLGRDPWGWTLGEFGLGANPVPQIRRLVTIDEKVLGTAHIALGNNLGFGGANPAATHYDCVMATPTITLDGKPLVLRA
jgi:leucyl aminopeptidase (aminopeptidase T)